VIHVLDMIKILGSIHFITLEIVFGCDMVSHNILEEVQDMSYKVYV
jgi:hypothetical protein